MGQDGWQAWRRGDRSSLPGLQPVIGHRGAAARAPENTLAGLRRAHELGAAWVEFDVMLTADRVPVLIHDETLERTTTGRGRGGTPYRGRDPRPGRRRLVRAGVCGRAGADARGGRGLAV